MMVLVPIPLSSLLNWLHRGVFFFKRAPGGDKAALFDALAGALGGGMRRRA